MVKEASTLFFVTKDQEPVPLWIIVLASVGGLLVVLVIVAIMWKVGFTVVAIICFNVVCYSATSSEGSTRRKFSQKTAKRLSMQTRPKITRPQRL